MREHVSLDSKTEPFRILIVDDQPMEIAQLKFLSWHLGIEVEIAFDGKQAWNLAKNRQYDLIVLDWLMPETSGEEFLNFLESGISREGGKNICNRVVIHTGSPWEVASLIEENIQILDIWQKPLPQNEYIKKLSKILIRRGG